VQRTGEGGRTLREAGVIGSIKLSYDLCTGNLEPAGWIWGGAGTHILGSWVGPYYFREGAFGRYNIGNLITCGTCNPACRPAEGSHGGWGVGFPHPHAARPMGAVPPR
jgi:hypothetical protein